MNDLKCFEMDDVWSEILTKMDKASSVCLKYTSRALYSLTDRLRVDSLISSYELGVSGSVGIVKWAMKNGALRCEHAREISRMQYRHYLDNGSLSRADRQNLHPLGCIKSGAARAGAVGLLKWLERNRICPHDDYPAIAVQYGVLNIIGVIKSRDRTLQHIAIRYGQLETLKLLGMKNKPEIVRLAALHGHVDILEYIGPRDPLSTALAAAEGGCPAVLSWMKSNGSILHHTVNPNWLASKAAKSGHVSILRWLVKEMPPYALNNGLIGVAERNEEMETAQWLVEYLGVNEG